MVCKKQSNWCNKNLNVIQGNDIASADEWFDVMAPLSDPRYMVTEHSKAGQWVVNT